MPCKSPEYQYSTKPNTMRGDGVLDLLIRNYHKGRKIWTTNLTCKIRIWGYSRHQASILLPKSACCGLLSDRVLQRISTLYRCRKTTSNLRKPFHIWNRIPGPLLGSPNYRKQRGQHALDNFHLTYQSVPHWAARKLVAAFLEPLKSSNMDTPHISYSFFLYPVLSLETWPGKPHL